MSERTVRKGAFTMKKHLTVILFLSLMIGVLPAIPVRLSRGGTKAAVPADKTANEVSTETQQETSLPETETAHETVSDEPYKVLNTADGEVTEVSVRDYVIGAVCAEMPASFEPEALKAQAAAAHTYAERQRALERAKPDASLKGADFSNDTSKYQGYFTKEQIKQYYGENFDEYYGKVSKAVDEVLPYILTYNGSPIISAFCSMSSGKTESAENAWGTAVDYLVPVDSSYDTSAPKYMEEVRFNAEALRDKLGSAFPDIKLEGDISEWLAVTDVSESGTVLTLTAGDKSISGNELRSALGLRSACFDIRYENDSAVITTRGFGHGVGMSQYGADAMAKDGHSWQEIVAHYYPGCTISES